MDFDFDMFIDRAHWTYAKSYAKRAPHWYCVRAEFGDDETFNKAIEFIRANAVTEYFFRTPFQYYYHKGYKYWTMGNPVEQTRIINRTRERYD